MINRQKGIVIGVGAALGVACLGIGVWFFMALSESRDAAAQRDSAYDQLKALYQAKVFPKPENIQRIRMIKWRWKRGQQEFPTFWQ